jgi:hypothetical protein
VLIWWGIKEEDANFMDDGKTCLTTNDELTLKYIKYLSAICKKDMTYIIRIIFERRRFRYVDLAFYHTDTYSLMDNIYESVTNLFTCLFESLPNIICDGIVCLLMIPFFLFQMVFFCFSFQDPVDFDEERWELTRSPPETVLVFKSSDLILAREWSDVIPIRTDIDNLQNTTFISHKWVGNSPDDEHFSLLVYLRVKVQLKEMTEFMWVDAVCVDQLDKVNSLKSIPLIVYQCSDVHLVSVVEGYQTSFWCQLETMEDDKVIVDWKSMKVLFEADVDDVLPELIGQFGVKSLPFILFHKKLWVQRSEHGRDLLA